MARIGNVRPQSRIYDYARKEYQPEYDMSKPVNGQTAYQRYTDKIIFPQKMIYAPYVDYEVKLGDTKSEQDELINHRKQVISGLNNKRIGDPKNMYELKVGSRSEGNMYDQAKTKPYVEMAPNTTGLYGDIFQQAPALDMMDDKQIYELTTVYKPDMVRPKTREDTTIEQMVGKNSDPSVRQVVSSANESTRDFMEAKLGSVLVYPSTDTNIGDGGGNIKVNYAKELNRGLEPKSAKQLYEENFLNPVSHTGVNMMQRDAQKARDTLSLFGNKQHLAVSESEPRLTNKMIHPHKYMKLISKQ
jgi:hypothetical protein